MQSEISATQANERLWRADDVTGPEVVKALGRVCEICRPSREVQAATLVMLREVRRGPAGPALETLQSLACNHLAA